MNQLKDEELIEQAEDKEAEKARQQQERLDYIKSVIDTMAGAQSAQELKKIHDSAVLRLTRRKDTKGAERISLEWKRITDADKEAAA